ncbi:MAG: uroporphyrinogen-III C-methyltransferase [candidate division Zixibacteria bacterium]|nr:uroporphyrinogen-III C-methyltransferase [candidate division Zixibacteria bacterium]
MSIKYYPIFLNLSGRPCVVVGAGRIAAPKIAGLLDVGADVTVVASVAKSKVAALATSGRIRLLQRPYTDGDLEGAALVIAATDDAAVNLAVHDEARRRDCLVNVVDTTPLCEFITPALVRRGDLTVAISTNGVAPALASVVRRRLERLLDDGYASFLDQARFWRRRLSRSGATFETKKSTWYDLVRAAEPSEHSGWGTKRSTPRIAALPHRRPHFSQSVGSYSWPLGVVGMDHAHAPLTRLEKASGSMGDGAATELRSLKTSAGGTLLNGVVVVATCQRLEVYYETLYPRQARRAVENAFARWCGITRQAVRPSLYSHYGLPAVDHLLHVTAGLESLVPLENEIQGQVRRAYTQARTLGTLSPRLATAFQGALAVGKQTRRDIGQAPRRSVGYRAVEFVQHRVPHLSQSRAIVIGDGPFAEVVSRALVEHGVNPRRMTAQPTGDGRAGSLPEIFIAPNDEKLGGDIVVFACHRTSGPFVTREEAAMLAGPGTSRVYIMDLGMPRNFAPEVSEIYGVTLWNLEDLAEIGRPQVEDAESVRLVRGRVERALERFASRRIKNEVAPAEIGSRLPIRVGQTHAHPSHPNPGKVYLVGAGPGSPGLITVRGLELVATADVILCDRLVSGEILTAAPRHCQVLHVGKVPDGPRTPQDEINRRMCDLALSGKTVVRLKGGDPFVFGRGAEEALFLLRAGIECEIVPGVSSAFAVPALAGIPLTHRGLARSFAVVTAQDGSDPDGAIGRIVRLAKTADTLVILMGLSRLPEIMTALRDHGVPSRQPAAVIAQGTTPHERIVVGTVGDLSTQVQAVGFRPPGTIVIGDVVMIHHLLRSGTNSMSNPPSQAPLPGGGDLIAPSEESAPSPHSIAAN